MQKTHVSWLAGAGFLLIATGLFGSFYAAPRFLRAMIIESTVLKDNSEALRRWTVMPQPMFYRIYLWHVVNAADVDKGARPKLVEKGPYHYDVYRERVDVKFHSEDDTVSYFDKSNFVFNKEKSGCHAEEDEVTVLNAPIVGTSLLLEKIMPMALAVFNEAIPYLADVKGAFVTAKVRDILFDGLLVNCSYPETMFPAGPVCQGLKSKAPVTFRYDPQSKNFFFSMLAHLNGTSKDRVRIIRGQRDSTQLGKIVEFRNSSTINMWRPDSPCNMVNGTDTTIFRPFVERSMRIPIFQSASCRSMYATYEYDSSYEGIPTFYMIADPNMFASGRDYRPNRCFCPMPSDDDDDDDDDDGGSKPASASAEGGKSGGGGGGGGGAAGAEEGGGGEGGGGGTEAAAEEGGGGEDGGADPGKGGEEGAAAEEEPAELLSGWEQAFRRIKRASKKTPDEKDAAPCLKTGAMDVSKCFGSPVIISLPHFYLGDPSYVSWPIGLKPDKEKHETFLELEPVSGVPIRGGKRVQLNMNVKRVEEVSIMKTVAEGMFPMLWVEEGVVLEGNNLQMVVSAIRWMRVLQATPWVLFGAGILTLLSAGVLYAHVTGMVRLVGINLPSASSRKGLDSGEISRGAAPLPHGNYGYDYNIRAPNKTLLLGVSEAPMKGIPTRYITGADGNALLNGAGRGYGGGGGGGGGANGVGNNRFGFGGDAKNNNGVLLGIDDRMRNNVYGMRDAVPVPPYEGKSPNNGAAAVYASGFLVQRKPTGQGGY